MNKNTTPIKTALISVSNKTGIIDFAKSLSALGVKIISTGGTATTLANANIPVSKVSDITGFPEMMNGRVKTLHPKIHGGILGERDKHAQDAEHNKIEWIDLVVCNLYPFQEVIKENVPFETAIENIDIGGPCMLRAAAKNMDWVSVVTDPSDYDTVLTQLNTHKGIDRQTREKLSAKAFALTAQYDAAIQEYLNPNTITLQYTNAEDLRYGENPHQTARVYRDHQKNTASILNAQQHQGKQLSYNNIVDADVAVECISEFSQPACVVIKHATPCGLAIADNINEAFTKAFNADSKSAFGGVIAINQTCTSEIAEYLSKVFFEILIAPGFSKESLEILSLKKNVRLLAVGHENQIKNEMQYRHVNGGLLVQSRDNHQLTISDLESVTQTKPDDDMLNQLLFSWHVAKHVRSNAIVIVKDNQTIGIGGGQVSRVDAVELAVLKSENNLKGAVLASDAFFPFRDSIDRLAETGIKAIIQPGGSVRDQEVIDACDEHGIAMVFTGLRCFLH